MLLKCLRLPNRFQLQAGQQTGHSWKKLDCSVIAFTYPNLLNGKNCHIARYALPPKFTPYNWRLLCKQDFSTIVYEFAESPARRGCGCGFKAALSLVYFEGMLEVCPGADIGHDTANFHMHEWYGKLKKWHWKLCLYNSLPTWKHRCAAKKKNLPAQRRDKRALATDGDGGMGLKRVTV